MSQAHKPNRSLQFPNARLFVHGLLSCGRAAPEAIAQSAWEFGLVDLESISKVLPAVGAVPCACMATARNVINRYCEERAQPNKAKLNEVVIWTVLQENAEDYTKECNTSKKLDTSVNPHDCRKFAPALFDLLLQELSRHPQ